MESPYEISLGRHKYLEKNTFPRQDIYAHYDDTKPMEQFSDFVRPVYTTKYQQSTCGVKFFFKLDKQNRF